MSGGLDLEQRYRRVLRLLPGYYRDQWEEDMVAAFLDSWLTGDPEVDECVLEFCRPDWPEVASVAGLAGRLYLGGAGAPRRYFAWGQAARNAVLAVMLVHVVRGVAALVLLAWSHRLAGWLPALPATLMAASPGGIWPAVFYVVDGAWIVIFAALLLGHYRTVQVIAALAIVPYLVFLLQQQFTASVPVNPGAWAFWVLLDLAPVLAMAAFHRDAPPAVRRPWLLALPAAYAAPPGQHHSRTPCGMRDIGAGYPWPWSNKRQPSGVLTKHWPHGCQPVGMVPSELPCVYISNSTHSSFAASLGCWDVVGASHRPIVQQLGVVAPVPGLGQGEFGGQLAVAGEGGAKIDASNSFRRCGDWQSGNTGCFGRA